MQWHPTSGWFINTTNQQIEFQFNDNNKYYDWIIEGKVLVHGYTTEYVIDHLQSPVQPTPKLLTVA